MPQNAEKWVMNGINEYMGRVCLCTESAAQQASRSIETDYVSKSRIVGSNPMNPSGGGNAKAYLEFSSQQNATERSVPIEYYCSPNHIFGELSTD